MSSSKFWCLFIPLQQVLHSINDHKTHILFTPARSNQCIYSRLKVARRLFSHTCIIMHACRKQSNQNKALITLHMNITSHYPYTNFVFARSTHIFCSPLKINNHFDLIIMSFSSSSPTANAPLKINWFSCLSFSFIPLHQVIHSK